MTGTGLISHLPVLITFTVFCRCERTECGFLTGHRLILHHFVLVIRPLPYTYSKSVYILKKLRFVFIVVNTHCLSALIDRNKYKVRSLKDQRDR